MEIFAFFNVQRYVYLTKSIFFQKSTYRRKYKTAQKSKFNDT